MAKRYIARGEFSLGRGKRFGTFIQKDGTAGYTRAQLEGRLTADQIRKNFHEVEVTGSIVEEATAAPGELRTITLHECDECEFEAKSAAGLAAHQRSHDE